MFKLSDFRKLEVVNLKDGRRLGYVVDLEIDVSTGCVVGIVLPGSSGGLSWLKRAPDIYIEWSKIAKIGTNYILVNDNLDTELEDDVYPTDDMR